MPALFLQSDRPLQVTTGAGPGRFLIAGFAGTEAVNDLFEFRLHLLAPNRLPPVEFDSVLGKPAAVRVRRPGGGFRTVHGLVTALTVAGTDQQFTHYFADLRPNWWPATLRTNSRVFQQQTVVEILQAVLGPFGPLDLRLGSDYPSRNYTTQYRETDWAFAARLMEEEGIFYFFRHDEDSEDDGLVLVLADSPAACRPVPGPFPLAYEDTPDAEKMTARPVTRTWDVTQELCPTATTVWDTHFAMFGRNLAGVAAAPAVLPVGAAEFHPAPPDGLEIPVYRHDGDYAKRYDGVAPGGGDRAEDLNGLYPDADRTAGLRQAQSAAGAVRVAARTNAPDLVPGAVATLIGHPRFDDRYIVTRGTLTATVPQAYWGIEAGTEYECTNAVALVPAVVAPRPPVRTPRPKVGGPLTAIVTGPEGQELFVDPYGRVKVKFFWDRFGPADANSSCWVRVSQLWAGPRWGAFFWPRVGMEVVVQFVDGDPDRPLVTGCVYNGANLPPGDLPAEAPIGGIKSCILGGLPSSQYNGLFFYDMADKQFAELHSMTHEIRTSMSNSVEFTPQHRITINGSL